VKRVIGTPGQTLTSKGNVVYVDGKPLKEPWTYWPTLNPPITKITLKANQYFVMGDNRANSCDSRFWAPCRVRHHRQSLLPDMATFENRISLDPSEGFDA